MEKTKTRYIYASIYEITCLFCKMQVMLKELVGGGEKHGDTGRLAWSSF